MNTTRATELVWLLAATTTWLAARADAGHPTNAELELRDRWVAEHFPAKALEPKNTPPLEPGLWVWTNYDRVLANSIPGKALAIADRKFEHGLYCHALSRVEVVLPTAAKSFSAVVGILTNPDSQGGSIVFSVDVGDRRVYTSSVKHRGEAGTPLDLELGGARDFFLEVDSAGDGIASDQAVWGGAQVATVDGREIRLGDLAIRDPRTRPRANFTPPFSFTFDRRSSDEWLPTWTFGETLDTSKPDRLTRVQSWSDPKTGLVVRNTIVAWTDYPTVEWSTSFENTSEHDTPVLEGILPLDARFERGEQGEFLLHHFVGSPCQANDYEPLESVLAPDSSLRINTAGGRPTNSDLPYFDVENGSDGGVIAVIGWSGQWAAQFTRDGGRGLRIAGGQESTSFRLHPGERVRSPLAVLQFYRGDWIRAQNVWRSWMLDHNLPRHDGKLLAPFVFGCTGNFYPGLKTDAATEIAFIEGYVRQRITPDYWDQDAGWYPCGDGWWNVGTWKVDETRWPKGLREGSDALHSHGIGSIVWFEPERLAPGTELAKEHPEWCIGGAGGGLMKLGDPDYRQWITDRLDRLITSEGIDFYRQDFNIDPLYYWRSNDTADRQGITEIRHVEGYLALWDELVRRHPKLWIDSCASGGRRNDLETLRRAVPILRSDYSGDPADPNYDPLSQQNHVYGISFWMPFHGSGFSPADAYWARSVMGPIVGVGVDTRKTDCDYETLRRLVEQIRAVQPCYLGDYYPLTPYSKNSDVWTAWQFDRPSIDRGLIQAFRRKTCAAGSITLKLRGLVPDANYELTNLDGGAPRRALGRELANPGLTVEAPAPQTALLFSYRRI